MTRTAWYQAGCEHWSQKVPSVSTCIATIQCCFGIAQHGISVLFTSQQWHLFDALINSNKC